MSVCLLAPSQLNSSMYGNDIKFYRLRSWEIISLVESVHPFVSVVLLAVFLSSFWQLQKGQAKSGTRWLSVAKGQMMWGWCWRGHSPTIGEGGSGDLPWENCEKIDSKWCVLGYFKESDTNFLDRLKLAKKILPVAKPFCQLPKFGNW